MLILDGGPGFNTGLQLYVDHDFVVIMVSNYNPPFPQLLANDIGQFLIKQN